MLRPEGWRGQSVEMLIINQWDCLFNMQVSDGKSSWLILNIFIDWILSNSNAA